MKKWLFLLIGLISLSWALSSCYVTRQGYYVLKHQFEAKDIGYMLRFEKLTPTQKKLFERVQDIKKFAVKKLGLSNDNNYTRYVKVSRNYLLDVVSASEKTAFKDYTWWFPIMGSFPYKGFFNRSDAQELAKELKAKNLDVLIRRSDAFSSLGYFSDPVYSYMEHYSIYELASLIIHEQAHATVFIKDKMQFNENLASFIGREGALNYISSILGKNSNEYQKAVLQISESRVFMKQIKGIAKKLETLYKSTKSKEKKLEERKLIYKKFQENYLKNYNKNFKSPSYRFFAKIPLNNAYLRLFLLYEANLGVFYKLYKKNNENLAKTIQILKTIPENSKAPLKFIKKLINPKKK